MNALWYKAPASGGEEALPVGNGRLGALVSGHPGHEVIRLSEESVWSGPGRDRNNRSSAGHGEQIRQLFREGKIARAQELAYESMTGTPPHQTRYLGAGELHLDFRTAGTGGLSGSGGERGGTSAGCTSYCRELDLETAIATTTFSVESTEPSTAIFAQNSRGSSITYTRETFVSAALDVLVVHVSASTPKSIFFRAEFDQGGRACTVSALEDCIAVQVTDGIPFCAMATAAVSGGTVTTRGNCLIVEGADEATVYVDVRTAYRNGHYARRRGAVGRSPEKLAAWCAEEALKKLCFALGGTYQDAKRAHTAEYAQWYARAQLSLPGGTEGEDALPTDELLKHPESPALAALCWNYGRYLLISCSRRPGTLPLPARGFWNAGGAGHAPGGYLLDGSLSLSYHAAAPCALEELEAPLFALLWRLCRNGLRTAEAMYGHDGTVAHHATDIWADSAPDGTEPSTAYWPLGAAWLSTHVWEHYEYTLDKKFLRRHFRLLLQAAGFMCRHLTPVPGTDRLSLVPSSLPGDSYRMPGGTEAALCCGTDADARILEHLFQCTLSAAKALGFPESHEILLQCRDALARLGAPAVTAQGTLRRWQDGAESAAPGNLPPVQLFGLYPGRSISRDRTPELAEAAALTVEKAVLPGGEDAAERLAWLMHFRASLADAEGASRVLTAFLSARPLRNAGTFGGISAMTRMLVQSELNGGKVQVTLLPALPPAWKDGTLRGAALKGNLRIDLSWHDGDITAAQVYALPGTAFIPGTVICFRGKRYEAPLTDGKLNVLNVLPSAR